MSDTTICKLTNKVLLLDKDWKSRPLVSIYAVVFMNTIHFHVRSEGCIIRKTVHIALNINMESYKDVLGM